MFFCTDGFYWLHGLENPKSRSWHFRYIICLRRIDAALEMWLRKTCGLSRINSYVVLSNSCSPLLNWARFQRTTTLFLEFFGRDFVWRCWWVLVVLSGSLLTVAICLDFYCGVKVGKIWTMRIFICYCCHLFIFLAKNGSIDIMFPARLFSCVRLSFYHITSVAQFASIDFDANHHL